MKLSSVYLVLLISLSSLAQSPLPKNYYDAKKKRLLIENCAIYLHSSNQGAIDADSSVVLTCKAYKLPVSLSYDEGYNEGGVLIGSEMIEKGNISGAKKLLSTSKDSDKMKILLQLGGFYLFKPGSKAPDLQNAKIFIDQAVKYSSVLKDNKWKNESLFLLAKYYAQSGNVEKSQKYFADIVAECRFLKDSTGLARALDNQTTYLSEVDPHKLELLKEAGALYKKLGLEEKRISINMRIVTLNFWSGNYAGAKKGLYQNLYDQRKIGFKHNQYTETTIAFIEETQLNLKQALYYALQSIRTIESTHDFNFADIYYMRLGNIYVNLGHYEEALEVYNKSIRLGKNNLDSGSWYKSYLNAVRAITLKGKHKEALDYLNSMSTVYPPKTDFDKMIFNYTKANCLADLKQPEAEKYYMRMVFYANKLNNPATDRDIANCFTTLADYYASKNNSAKAKLYIDKVSKIAESKKIDYDFALYEHILFKIDSLSGNYQSSLKHFQNFKKLSDSTVNILQRKQIEELKVQYETVNKEQKISLLNKQSKLQESALNKSIMLNNLSIGSLVLLLITIALLYNRYRIKQLHNEKLEIKEKEINQKNINLSQLLEEKEWLLKEVHHRVKNNLQTVISLLSSQSAFLDNAMALSAIKNSQNRIHSMSLIHQKLYSSENISNINMSSYIKELVEYLRDSFALDLRIRFELKIDSLELDVTQAIPLGLILNEAITNAIKYAFPDNREGTIYITLEKTRENLYQLKIVDDGVGIDNSLLDKKRNSFGMNLIKGLSDDLEAELQLQTDQGTEIKIEFLPEFPITKRSTRNL